MRSPSMREGTATRCRAWSAPDCMADCGSNTVGSAIAATTERTLPTLGPMGAGIQAKSESLGAPAMAFIRSSVNSSARSVSAFTTVVAGCEDTDHFVDGKPPADGCFIAAPYLGSGSPMKVSNRRPAEVKGVASTVVVELGVDVNPGGSPYPWPRGRIITPSDPSRTPPDRAAPRVGRLRGFGPFGAAGGEQPRDLVGVHIAEIPHVGHTARRSPPSAKRSSSQGGNLPADYRRANQ